MSESPLLWASLTIGCLLFQAFYAMEEMACVSFDKVRLHYFLTKNDHRAKWISYLLSNPSRLFGTTLLAVNVALQVGSECSRLFYESLGLSPNLAPITQVILVLVFAEMSPMIAGRRYSEHAALLGSGILYYSCRMVTPFLWFINHVSTLIQLVIGSRPTAADQFLSREELQRILEAQDVGDESDDFNVIVSNIFNLRGKTAQHAMEPIHNIQMLPSNCTVGRMRQILESTYFAHLPIYHRSPRNVVGIACPRDLLRVPDNHRVRDHGRSPWFITQNTALLQILKQFRNNNQSLAIVLDDTGSAVGVLTLDDILVQIFGSYDYAEPRRMGLSTDSRTVIDRTFPAEMQVADFNAQFDADLDAQGMQTLAELATKLLGHSPKEGETVRAGRFELSITEANILGVRRISVKSHVR